MKTYARIDVAPGITAHTTISFEGGTITAFTVSRVTIALELVKGPQRVVGPTGMFSLPDLRQFATQLSDVCTQLEEQTSINSSELAGQSPASESGEENASEKLATPNERVTKETPTQSTHKPAPEHPSDGARDGST